MATAGLLTSHATWNGVALLRLTGDMDLAQAPQVAQLAEQLLTEDVHLLRVDISKVDFIDAAGLGCLVAIRNATVAYDRALLVEHSTRTRRLFDLFNLQ